MAFLPAGYPNGDVGEEEKLETQMKEMSIIIDVALANNAGGHMFNHCPFHN